MRATSTRLAALSLGIALAGCEPTIQVALKVVQPCDQGDALEGAGTLRFEITGGTYQKAYASNFSRGNKSGQITGLPLGEDVQVTVKAYSGDVDKNPDVLKGDPVAIGASQPRDYVAETEERAIEIAVPVGKVETFASTTNASSGKCTAMTTKRHGHTATYLPKIGKVLIAGGAVADENGTDTPLATAELYDPATGTFTKLPEPPGGPRMYHAAVALPDGRALITGGIGVINNVRQTLGSGYVYDPSLPPSQYPYTLVVMPTHQARAHHSATLSETGNVVLLVGGCTNSGGQVCDRSSADNAFESTLLFDVAQLEKGNNALSVGPDLPGGAGRVFHVALALQDGRILIAGGSTGSPAAPACRFLLYDSRQNAFLEEVTDNLPTEGCTSHLAGAVLEDGRVILTGGYKSLSADGSPPADPAQMSRATTIWVTEDTVRVSNGPALNDARAEHATFALPGGDALVTGGHSDGANDAERVDMDAQVAQPTTGFPASKRIAMGAVQLGSGQPLLLGGLDMSGGVGVSSDAGELFFAAP